MKRITDNAYLTKKFLAEKVMKCLEGVSFKYILDVGCGEKPYKTYFPNTDYYVGIDKESLSADIRGVGEYLPFKRKVFDTAICTQVLEHVDQPKRVLKELNRILSYKGVLILSTHGFWAEGHEKTDYWRWTLQGLVKIFKDSGFNIIDSYSMEPFPSLFQFISLFIPANLFGKILQVFINFIGLFLKTLGNKGANLYVVHIIKATKKSSVKHHICLED